MDRFVSHRTRASRVFYSNLAEPLAKLGFARIDMVSGKFKLRQRPDGRWTVIDAVTEGEVLPQRLARSGLLHEDAVLLAHLLNTLLRKGPVEDVPGSLH